MIYWYESACLTCLAAWGTTLGWSQVSNMAKTAVEKSRSFASIGRLFLPVGLTAGAFIALRRKDYY